MTTDPHLEADIAWLEAIKCDKGRTDQVAVISQVTNARIDRLLARIGMAGGGGVTSSSDRPTCNLDCLNYEGAMADLDSAITVLIHRINGHADLASAAEWVRRNYPKRASEIAPASPVGDATDLAMDALRETLTLSDEAWVEVDAAIRDALASPLPIVPGGWFDMATAPRCKPTEQLIDLWHGKQGRVPNCFWRTERLPTHIAPHWATSPGGYNMGTDDAFEAWRYPPAPPAMVSARPLPAGGEEK